MASSLASLVQNLKSLPLTQNLKKQYPNLTDEVITRKGVFPYAYFDNISKLSETSLPSIDKFKNDLTGIECKVEDYNHAQVAWTNLTVKHLAIL